MVNPVPEGTHTVTPHLIVRGGDRAIDFYKRAFGAKELMRMPDPQGKLMHAELQIGDSRVYLADEFPAWGSLSPLALKGSPVVIHLYVEDADAVFQRALSAGAKVRQPLADAFWGDRYGQVADPFGHFWSVATHKEDLTPEEMMKRGESAFLAPPPKAARPRTKKKARARKASGKKAPRRKAGRGGRRRR